ncbi:MAG: hypothetical protein JST16_19040 [Bdellovibrionales bacterium]|nr:hypothetical protein [Bdellovibrionales bacterium]
MTNAAQTIEFQEFFAKIYARRKLILALVTISTAAFIVASYFMPKRYKSTFSMNISSQYFHNPLVQDFVPDITDPSELKFQREALIRKAFTDEFIDKIAGLMGGYKNPEGDIRRTREREDLFRSIEVISLGPTSFQVAYLTSTPAQALSTSQATLDQIIRTLTNEKIVALKNVRDAIRERLDTLNLGDTSATTDPRVSSRVDTVEREALRLQSEIDTLTLRYSDQHPEVVALQGKLKTLKAWLRPNAANTNGKKAALADDMISARAKGMGSEAYEDLVRKFNLLNVAIELNTRGDLGATVVVLQPPRLPQTPFYPNKSLFAVWGVLAGLLLSAAVMFLEETLQGTRRTPAQLAELLRTPLLGQIPSFSQPSRSDRDHRTVGTPTAHI